MPQVALLAVDGYYLSSAAGFADVLQVANVHRRDQQGPSCDQFEWTFVSARGGPVTASNGLRIETERYDARARYDVVTIPAIFYPGYKPFAKLLDGQAETCGWLRAQWKGGAWIGANCTGTFLLGIATGNLEPVASVLQRDLGGAQQRHIMRAIGVLVSIRDPIAPGFDFLG